MPVTAPSAAPPAMAAPPQEPVPSGWSTASFGHAPDTSPGELELLGDHLDGCRARGGRWFVWSCRADALKRFVGAHAVTTLAAVTVLAGAALLLF